MSTHILVALSSTTIHRTEPQEEDGATYDEDPPDDMYQQSSQDQAATDPDEPGLYWKFNNPIYGDVDTKYK